MSEMPLNPDELAAAEQFDAEAAQAAKSLIDKQHQAIQEGVIHGPYVPTEDPFEQQTRQHKAVEEAFNNEHATNEQRSELHSAINEVTSATAKEIRKGNFENLATPARDKLEEEIANPAPTDKVKPPEVRRPPLNLINQLTPNQIEKSKEPEEEPRRKRRSPLLFS